MGLCDQTFCLPPHCLQNVSLNDPSGEGSVLLYTHGLWWKREQCREARTEKTVMSPCPLTHLFPLWTQDVFQKSSCGSCKWGGDVTLGGGRSTRVGVCFIWEVRCGFGEALAHYLFVFLGFNCGSGVAAAVGSLLRHQCWALLLHPGSCHTGALPSHCPLPVQCVQPKVCQVPQ